MFIVEVLVGLVLLVGVAWLLSRADVQWLGEPEHDAPDAGLPDDRLLRSDDLDRLQLRVVAGLRGGRGYRFADVDATLAKVRESLAAHEARAAAPRE